MIGIYVCLLVIVLCMYKINSLAGKSEISQGEEDD